MLCLPYAGFFNQNFKYNQRTPNEMERKFLKIIYIYINQLFGITDMFICKFFNVPEGPPGLYCLKMIRHFLMNLYRFHLFMNSIFSLYYLFPKIEFRKKRANLNTCLQTLFLNCCFEVTCSDEFSASLC